MPDTPAKHTILVTGANRGVGLELARQYANAGWRVLACCRDKRSAKDLNDLAERYPRLMTFALDVTDCDQITRLARQLGNETIDLLLNCAGYYGPKGVGLGQVDKREWLRVLEVNTIAPLMMAQAFVPQVARSELKIIATLSSKVGSIADNSSGGGYLYRSSKTAVNQVVKSLSIDLANKGIKAVALHPGWVKTEMGGPNALISTTESVAGLKQVLDNLTRDQSGRFFNYDGTPIPW